MQADDKAVRQRVCQVLAAALAQQTELSPDVAEELEAALLARLRDKLPAVRAEAAKALSMFADPGPVRASPCSALTAPVSGLDTGTPEEHRGDDGRRNMSVKVPTRGCEDANALNATAVSGLVLLCVAASGADM